MGVFSAKLLVSLFGIILVLSSIQCTSNDDDSDILTSEEINPSESNNSEVINTESGPVRGKKLRTLLAEKIYYSFKGIPYAKPPIGKELRFKPPVKAEPWVETLDAFEFKNYCIQTTLFNPNEFIGDEDCLFINVDTPDLHPKEPLPVVFNIHGGAFYCGYGDMLGPDFMLDQDVIMVSFNYRVGPIGFLSLGSPEYSGNMGLKDQLLALKWTYENIHHFGGDNKKITIYGESAGGASAHYHLLSKESVKYFKRAIVQSGSALNPWAFYPKMDHLNQLASLAELSNFPTDNMEDLINYLVNVDGKYLTSRTYQHFYIPGLPRKNIVLTWSPIVEPSGTVDPFLSYSPEEILEGYYTSEIDTLFTYNSNEMYLTVMPEVKNPRVIQDFNDKMEIHLPLAESKLQYNSELYVNISKEIRTYYFGAEDATIDGDRDIEYSNLLSEIYFTYGVHVAAKIQAKKSTGKTYNYVYSGRTAYGASHGEDGTYIYRRVGLMDKFYEEMDESSLEMVNTLTSLLANFAKYGNPIPNNEPVEFKPMTRKEHNYLNIKFTGLETGVSPNEENFTFWDKLLKKYQKNWKRAKPPTRPKEEL